jgi:molybdenum cofactor cytidylyltransferase
VLNDLPLSLIRCEEWQLGMGNSLATGIRALDHVFPQATAVLVCLADQPLLDTAALRAMLERHRSAPERILACTHTGGIQGPPALFPQDCFRALAGLSGPHGARQLLKREIARVEAFAASAGIDVDAPADLQRVRAMLGLPGEEA